MHKTFMRMKNLKSVCVYLLDQEPVSEVADDAHAGGDEEVDQLALVLVVGGAGLVPALEAAEHDLGAGEARQRGLHRLEAVGAVLAHVLGQHVRHYRLLHSHHLAHRDVLAGHGVPGNIVLHCTVL